LSPIDDWNELLPYHRWNLPAGQWLTSTTNDWQYDAGGYYWSEYVFTGSESCTYAEWYQVNTATYVTRTWDLQTSAHFELLDGPNGDPIDLDIDRFPYFPDYTFDHLFPGMTRSDWLELIDILDIEIPFPVSNAAQERVAGVRR
jgi:hypothetical protein